MVDSKLKISDLSLIQMSHLVSYTLGEKGDEAVVLDVINSSGEKITTSNICSFINKIFKVEIDQTRIDSAITKLKVSDRIYEQNGIFSISPLLQGEINRLSQSNLLIETLALKEWADNFELVNELVLNETDRGKLYETINTFIKTVFLRHGAISYSLIDTKIDNFEVFDLRDIVSNAVSNTPEKFKQSVRSYLSNCIFHLDCTNNQKLYLNNQISKAVSYISMVASPEFMSKIKEKASKITIYLDTSIIFRLLNLQGAERFESSKKLISVCEEYNIKLKIFNKSYSELKYSIDRYAKEIIKYPTPVAYNELSYKIRSTDNYISTFWSESSKNRVSASDFNDKYRNLSPYLKSYNIEIDQTDYSGINEVGNLIDDYKSKIRQHESVDPTVQKPSHNLEHDAYCLAAVSTLQIEYSENILDAQYIFLTSDRVLMKLQHSEDHQSKTPISILPSQLMQILCFTKPTTTYYDTFVGLFSSSKTYFGLDLSNSNISAIVGRVSLYSKDSVEIVEDILSNKIVQNLFKSYYSSEVDKDAMINAAITKEIENLIQANSDKEEEKKVLQNENDKLLLKSEEIENKIVLESQDYIENLKKVESERDKAIEDRKKTGAYYSKKAKSYAIRKSYITILLSCISFLIPLTIIIVYALALFPPTSYLIKPLIDYLKTSAVFSVNSSSESVLTWSLPLVSFAMTGFSIKNIIEKISKFDLLKAKYETDFYEKY